MSEWKEYKISEFAEVVAGGTPSTKKEEYYNGEIPWITPKDLTSHNERFITKGERSITLEGLKNSSAKLLPANTVLLTSRAPIGYLAIAKNPVATNQGFKNLIVDKEIADYNFIYYLLKSNIDFIKSHGSGTTFSEISGAVTKSISLSIPDLQTQKAIAEILSSLDDKIELNNKINKNLEQLAQTIFNNLLERNANQSPVSVEHFILFNPRMSIKKGTLTTFVEMKFLPTTGMNVTEIGEKPFTAGSKFMANDTLLARITPCLENGKTAFVNFLKEGEKGFGSTEFITMRAHENSCPEFVYCLSRNPAFRNHAIGSMVGSSGRQRIQLDMLKDFEIPKLSKEQICKFKNFSEPIFKQISHNRKENTNLIQLRDTLLPELITGKLEVSEQK
jgi:type I restriction enzyme S subunit